MSYQRTARVSGVDAEAGTFKMTLASEGEASDGHVLSIEGGRIPEQMPLLVSHFNDPSSQAGSVLRPRKHLKQTPRTLSATGQIETTGEGPTADIRRDLLHMIDRGHVGAVSIRWDAEEKDVIPRIDLPDEHPFRVDADKEPFGSPRRWGLFFKRWRAIEGSVVAVGADPQALIGRANETEGDVKAFWQRMAEDAVESTDEESLERRLARVREVVNEAREAGATLTDCMNAVADLDEDGLEDTDIRAVEIEGETLFLTALQADVLEFKMSPADEPEPRADEAPAAADEESVVEGSAPDREPARESPSKFDPKALFAELHTMLDDQDIKLRGEMQQILNAATGRVS